MLIETTPFANNKLNENSPPLTHTHIHTHARTHAHCGGLSCFMITCRNNYNILFGNCVFHAPIQHVKLYSRIEMLSCICYINRELSSFAMHMQHLYMIDFNQLLGKVCCISDLALMFGWFQFCTTTYIGIGGTLHVSEWKVACLDTVSWMFVCVFVFLLFIHSQIREIYIYIYIPSIYIYIYILINLIFVFLNKPY